SAASYLYKSQIPLPPEPDDEEAMMAEAGGPVPDSAPAPQNDPEELARRLLAEHLGAQPID
ncbi:hypothetical protein, partial [Amycolatopsis ruanii]|uniref:hypothetical protein n=1 Tax=Amycolatopsis ruanii TaxID=944491 RepID=UPI0013BE95AC